MLGFHYLKVNPTQYVIRFVGGSKRQAGAGISFVYYRPTSTVVVVPIGSTDVPFIFEQMTADFQTVTVQGQLTYRIVDPEKVASLLDYSIEVQMNRYRSDDPEKLSQRLVNQAQIISRAAITSVPLRDAILAVDRIAADVFGTLNTDGTLKALGVEILSFTISQIKPVPEMARALEAEARETLMKQSDDAIYSRRNAAIEQERKIKENELNTEIAVEEKRRQIRETQAAANLAVEAKEQELRQQQLIGQIKLEDDRKQLISLQTENARAKADADTYTLRASLAPLTEVSADVLQALSLQTAEPRLMIARAVNELAQNATKIGNLNISPDLLQTLLQAKENKP